MKKTHTHNVHIYCPCCSQQFHAFVYGNDQAGIKGSKAREELRLRVLAQHADEIYITPCADPEGLKTWLERAQRSAEIGREMNIMRRRYSKEG